MLFRSSTITTLGPSTGGYLNRPAHLGVHYEGHDGRGNLEVLLHREGSDWRIMALIPRP